jgi:UDP-GlcNAc:undecaprenyl-phosphate/decaprenyl-phosphate GlcNAc-1-phosphate transferase
MADIYWLVLLSVLGPLAISLVANAVVRRWAARRGFVDRPGGRKAHNAEVPLGGGIGIVLAVGLPIVGVVLTVWALGSLPGQRLPEILKVHQTGLWTRSGMGMGILAGLLVLHVLGLIDDVRQLGPFVKLGVQIGVAAFVVVVLETRLLTLLGTIPSIVVSVLWIVLITNAFNFLDNMDGLCAGVGAIVCTILAWSSLRAGQVFVPLLSFVLVGSLLGFLAYNFSPASLFMGDAGSLPVGYLVAVLTIRATYYDPAMGRNPAGVIVPLVLLAVPLYDVASVIYARWRAGAQILVGDRRHFSHRLVHRGMRPRTAVLTIYLATAATGLGAIFLPQADWPMAGVIFGQCACVVMMVALLEWRSGHGSR